MVQDPNDLANSRNGTVYSYDLMDRPLSVTYADGGSTTYSYTDSIPNKVTTTVVINSTLGVNKTTVLERDYLGRDRKTSLTTDPDGTTYTRMAYDNMGRKYEEWNPTRCDPDTYSSCSGETTFGYTQHHYNDALGRETSTVKQDGSAVSTAYSVNTTTVTDEAGVAHASTTDALARLTQVSEVNMGWITAYTYDALGNLTCVEQHGGVSGTGCSSSVTNDASSPWRIRRFTYDSLSHLLAAKNPEAGTSTVSCNGSTNPWSICYTYNNDGVLTTKTDTRGMMINYSPTGSPLDALHRVTEKTYSNSDPTITYSYDGGSASANGILHRTGMTDASGSTTWTYDSEGRALTENRTIAGNNKAISTQYNLDGSMWKLTYPSGAIVDYTPGGAGRPLAVHDDTNSIQYVKQPLSGAMYAPQGALQSAIFGYSSGFAGLTEFDQYNTRLQPALLSAAAPSGTVMSLSYNFHSGSGDNGNVLGITNNKDNTRSESFTYDSDNRISKAQGGTLWGATFTIDAWGNLIQTGTVAGTTTLAMSVNQQVNDANRFTLLGYTYDAAGNVLADGVNTGCGSYAYSWNAEEQMTCGSGATYTYDGDGGRVEKTGGGSAPTLYWGGEAGDALGESNTSGTLTSEYIFLNGKRIARRDLSGGAVYYYFSDELGSSDVVTNSTGVIQNESDFYPYGGERQVVLNLSNQHYKFTGKERDSESGNDYFGARYYSSSMGRFLSADWSAKLEPVPYARLADPQSLNLYAYVDNNPASAHDPDGHLEQPPLRDQFFRKLFENRAWGAIYFLAGQGQMGSMFGGLALFVAERHQAQNQGSQESPLTREIIHGENEKFNECVKEEYNHAIIKAMVDVSHDNLHDASDALKEASPEASKPMPKEGVENKVVTELSMAIVDLHKECLLKHPLAALSPDYNGLVKPGDIGRLSKWEETLSDFIK
jgi:RHS repeat-associated protein